jgi:hypothetical protein
MNRSHSFSPGGNFFFLMFLLLSWRNWRKDPSDDLSVFGCWFFGVMIALNVIMAIRSWRASRR